MFLGVPTDTVGGVSIDLDLKHHGVVLDVALVRVQDVRPAHVVREAPVILLADHKNIMVSSETRQISQGSSSKV